MCPEQVKTAKSRFDTTNGRGQIVPMIGGGKYDSESELVQQRTQADTVVLMVLGGNRGHGFSVTGKPEFMPKIPELLRDLADMIEDEQVQEAKRQGN